jgi:hypothetical protein
MFQLFLGSFSKGTEQESVDKTTEVVCFRDTITLTDE